MTQAFNLSQVANRVDSSGKLDGSTALNGTLPIVNGGTNNTSLAVTAGGVVYTDGSKLVNVGLGTTGQALISNASSAPTWQSVTPSAYTFLGTLTPTAGSTSATISGLNLTNYKFVFIIATGQVRPYGAPTQQYYTVGAARLQGSATATGQFVYGIISLDLIYGYCAHGWTNGPSSDNLRFAHGITTSSTGITLTATNITFNATPFYFLGGL